MTENDDTRFVEIAFYPDETWDDPTLVEFLWSEPLADGSYRVATSPYYAYGVSCGDIVEVATDPELHFVRTLSQSGHSTLRVLLMDKVDAEGYFEVLEAAGCRPYPTDRDGFFTLDVPATVDLTKVLDYLSTGQDDDRCDWAVGAISSVHARMLREVMDVNDLPDWVPRE